MNSKAGQLTSPLRKSMSVCLTSKSCQQKKNAPCTPTHRSNQLTAQATAGANSLSTSPTPPDLGTSCALSVRQGELSCAWSGLSVPTLTVASSACPTRSSSTIADTSVPTTPVIPPLAAGGVVHGIVANITSHSQANMPTSCSIIFPPPVYQCW
jgi:hypothetical protein